MLKYYYCDLPLHDQYHIEPRKRKMTKQEKEEEEKKQKEEAENAPYRLLVQEGNP